MEVPEEVLKRVAGFVYEKKQLRLDMFIERLPREVDGALLLKPLNGFYKVLSLGFKCPYSELVVCFTAF